MRRLACILVLLGIGPISLLAARPILVFPSLPSSFYGTVKINGANVPDDTLVQASIHGKIISETQTETYQGDSFYSLDIPGDDPDTLAVEGGHDGDTIIFILGGIVADQTGIWKSSSIISLNLSASSVSTQIPAQVMHTSVPTRTAIILMKATAIPLTTEALSTPINALLNPGSSSPTAAFPVATNTEKVPVVYSTTNPAIGIVVTGFILFIALFSILWLIRERTPKVE